MKRGYPFVRNKQNLYFLSMWRGNQQTGKVNLTHHVTLDQAKPSKINTSFLENIGGIIDLVLMVMKRLEQNLALISLVKK